MRKYGSIEFAVKKAKNLAGAALKEFNTAFSDVPDSGDKEFIRNMILYMVERFE